MAGNVLVRYGLDRYMTTIVGGDTLAQRKPDPAPLLACAARCGTATSDTVYVGDSEVDAATAAAAGTAFVLHTRDYRRAPNADITCAATFDDFAALPALLRRLGFACPTPA